MARVLVIYLGDLQRGPRALRQITVLREEHTVIGAGFAPSAFDDVEFIDLLKARDEVPPSPPWTGVWFTIRHRLLMLPRDRWRLLRGRVDSAYFQRDFLRRWADALADVHPDVVLVSGDAYMLPIGFCAARGAPVIFDAQEHAPSENASVRRWRIHHQPLVKAIWHEYLPRTAALIAVGAGSAGIYEQETGARATVITNAVPFVDLEPSSVDPDEIRMVHWGIAGPQRHLEDTIELMRHLDNRYRLDLVFINESPYVDQLKRQAADDPRIRFVPPVAIEDVPAFGNAYDIGVVLFRDSDIQHEYALPNKFFESIQARLAVATGPSPDMARISREWGFGIIGADYSPQAVAQAISAASPERLTELKRNAHEAARVLCAEQNDGILREVVAQALQANEEGSQPTEPRLGVGRTADA